MGSAVHLTVHCVLEVSECDPFLLLRYVPVDDAVEYPTGVVLPCLPDSETVVEDQEPSRSSGYASNPLELQKLLFMLRQSLALVGPRLSPELLACLRSYDV